jgi:outer membrane protein assembly factor BamB
MTGQSILGYSTSGSDAPAVVAGWRVYLSGFDRLFAFSFTTGVQSRFFDPGAVISVINDGILYRATESSFEAIDIRSKTRIRRVPFTSTACSPILANDVIYVGSGSWIDAIDASTGQLLLTSYTGRPVRQVIVANGADHLDIGRISRGRRRSCTLGSSRLRM